MVEGGDTPGTTASAVLVSTAGLQLELRRLFQMAPPNLALRQALQSIGDHFGAVYTALHGCVAAEPLSEEWRDPEFVLGEGLREKVNEAMFGALGAGAARCLRLRVHGGALREGALIAVAPMFDEELLAAGAAAMIVPSSDPVLARSLLASFESVVGFLALLASHETDLERRMESAARERRGVGEVAAAAAAHAGAASDEDPWRVGWDLVASVQARHGIEQVAVGMVDPGRRTVAVKVVTGMDEVRAGNPGVRAMRAAMEEALDRGETTLWAGRHRPKLDDPDENPDDPRLHRQWSDRCGGDAVATVLVRFRDVPVAVLALRDPSVERLRLARLKAVELELQAWGGMLPLVERAGRSVAGHLVDAGRARFRRVAGQGLRKVAVAAVLLAGLVAAGMLVRVDDALHASAVLVPGEARTVSCPRSAPLLSVHVRPGDPVRAGDVIARLDVREDRLAAEEARARAEVLAVEAEVARAEGDLGALRVAETRLAGVRGELALLEERIGQATVRAPVDGIVLEGDLRERVGDRLALGERICRIGAEERIAVEIRIPDRTLPSPERLADAQAHFSPFAMPGRAVALGPCTVPPAASVVDGDAVYLVEAAARDSEGLRPGMEGTVRIGFGAVPVWAAAGRPVVRWLRWSLGL